MRLIPAIDLLAGHCVRLLQGDFDAETRYDADPQALLAKYRDYGADWLHVVDLDGARDGALRNLTIVAALAAQKAVKLQVGGGMRDAMVIAQMLRLGVTRVVVGSAAATQTNMVRAWLKEFGRERMTLALDVRLDETGVPRVTSHGWREQSQVSLWNAVEDFLPAGLKHVLCTDVSRDGALSGPNIGLYQEAAKRFPQIEWQASGGIRDAPDLRALAESGAAAAISGKALLEDLIPIEDLRPFLPNALSPA
jgi:phosphoribosylformimino-5-aminoimidazole carboxamide ribotide isomerase